MRPLFLMGLCLILLASACDNRRFYEKNISIPQEEWPVNNTVQFEVEISDTLSPYHLFLNLRNATQYPYRNFYVFMYTQYPDKRIKKDTIEIPLATPDGRWLGKTYGNMVDTRIWIKENQRFSQSGQYTFVLEHGMRQDTVKHIADIGLRIEKAI